MRLSFFCAVACESEDHEAAAMAGDGKVALLHFAVKDLWSV